MVSPGDPRALAQACYKIVDRGRSGLGPEQHAGEDSETGGRKIRDWLPLVTKAEYLQALSRPLTCRYVVELRGFEPLTPSMRTRCATGLRYSPWNASQRSKLGRLLALGDHLARPRLGSELVSQLD